MTVLRLKKNHKLRSDVVYHCRLCKYRNTGDTFFSEAYCSPFCYVFIAYGYYEKGEKCLTAKGLQLLTQINETTKSIPA